MGILQRRYTRRIMYISGAGRNTKSFVARLTNVPKIVDATICRSIAGLKSRRRIMTSINM